MNYIIVQVKTLDANDLKHLMSILVKEIRISKTDELDDFLILYYDKRYYDQDIKQVFLNYVDDFFVDVRIFISDCFSPSAYDVIMMLEQVNFGPTKIYHNKDLYLEVLNPHNKQNLKQYILGNYAKDEVMLGLIKTYANSNLNISKTAKQTYFHRNTVMQKFEKFKIDTNFDLKDFIDLFIIYYLIN